MIFVKKINFSEFVVFWTGFILIFVIVFVGVGGMFLITDMTGRPKWMLKYKLQPKKNNPVDVNRVRSIVPTVIGNWFLGVGIVIPLLYVLMKWRGCNTSLRMPDILESLAGLAICTIIEEIGFYYSHRALHHAWFYRTIHKKHHEWTAPVGIVAIYAHPMEFIISNITPLVFGPLIYKTDLITTWTWIGLATFITVCHHSGYHIPFLPSSKFHDYHHAKFNQNYGVLGVLDWLHGTDMEYRKNNSGK